MKYSSELIQNQTEPLAISKLKIAEAYKKKKEAKLTGLETDHTETSNGQHPPLSVEEDNDLFIQVG